MKENLSKENFWNALYEKYPQATQMFCDWINDYKKVNDWDGLFNGILPTQTVAGAIVVRAPKFDDLPLAMQVGILIQFFYENESINGLCFWKVDLLRTDWRKELEEVFKSLQIILLSRQQESETK